MTRDRIPGWEQRKVLAEWLWERGPMHATYVGQMAAQVAAVLNQKLDRRAPFDRNAAIRLLVDMVNEGLIEREGDQLITMIRYVGQDPETVMWQPERPLQPERP